MCTSENHDINTQQNYPPGSRLLRFTDQEGGNCRPAWAANQRSLILSTKDGKDPLTVRSRVIKIFCKAYRIYGDMGS